MNIIEFLPEQKIRKAIIEGEFDNLSGFGKPVDNSEYFGVPEEDRIAYHIMKNAGLVPEEVNMRKDLYHLRQQLKKCGDLTLRERLLLKINEMENRLLFTKSKKAGLK